MMILAKLDLGDILKKTGKKFGEYVKDLGYEEYSYEVVSSPRVTNRGLLRAKGKFTGPSPYGDAQRPVEDECAYTFYVTEDTNFKHLLVIEVKLNGALLAKFKVQSKGIYILDGSLPHA